MFALSSLADSELQLPRHIVEGLPDLRGLPSEYRFAVPGVSAVRLPKQLELLERALAEAGDEASLLWVALSSPVHRVPLVAPKGERRVGLIGGGTDGEMLVAVEARLAILPGAKRYDPSELTAVTFGSARGVDAIVERLERLWLDAEPTARAAAGGPKALWLGGNPARELHRGDEHVRAVCAAFGMDGEVVSDASRHVREVRTRLGSKPPQYLIVWRPQAFGVEPAVAAFLDATEGDVVELIEPSFDDALLELRWALCDRGLDGRPPADAMTSGTSQPASGEERFYIKHYGTKIGDRMIEVLDCGHGQWGGDKRSKAPRALKGIVAGSGVEPQALFRCAKCSKNRWRARF